MKKTERNISILKAYDSGTLSDCCLTWGFPCIVMLVISVLASVRIGAQFNERPDIEYCVFIITFALQALVYYTVFQYMLTNLCCMLKVSISISHGKVAGKDGKDTMVGITTVDNTDAVKESADNTPKVAAEDTKTMVEGIPMEDKLMHKSNEVTEADKVILPIVSDEPKETEIPELPVLSSEAYQQRNSEYMAELAAEKSRILAIILEYVHYTMSCFIEEEEMTALCQEIVNWADDPTYAPKSVNLKEELSTIELRHFVWNIGERLGRENGYDGYTRALFAKSLFPYEFSGIEIDTIKNFTVEPCKGRIKLDRPDPDSCEFHYGKK